jgi:hypothetical protein
MADLFTKITAEGPPASSPYEFSSITVETDNTFAPSTDQAHAGSYSYKAYFGGTSGSNQCYGSKTFTESMTARVKWWFRFNSTLNVSNIIPASLLDNGTVLIYPRMSYSSGYAIDRIYYTTDAGTSYAGVSVSLAADTWHSIEFFYKTASSDGANDGEYWVKVNDTVVASATGMDNDTRIADRTQAGNTGAGVPATGSIIYIDDGEGKDAVPVGTVYKKGILFRRVVGTTSILKKFMFIKRAI